ncbi:MAG: DUF5677 domain-containing protein, partial [Nitrospirota bacterium]
MATVLTPEQIEAAVNALPVQGRIMLHLLLVQYLDVTQGDVEYMAADRPDPRFLSGQKPKTPYISQETMQGLTDRVAQYRTQARQRRERAWLQITCLQKQIVLSEALCSLAEHLLGSRFGMDAEAVQELKKRARTAIPKTAIRELDRKWETDEITEEGYRKERLCIEYQSQLRKLERERRRLEIAKREFDTSGGGPLQDHEICHIWGIPASTLAARLLEQVILGLHLKGVDLVRSIQMLQGELGSFGSALILERTLFETLVNVRYILTADSEARAVAFAAHTAIRTYPLALGKSSP